MMMIVFGGCVDYDDGRRRMMITNADGNSTTNTTNTSLYDILVYKFMI